MFPGEAAHPFVIDYLFLILYVPLKCQPSNWCAFCNRSLDTIPFVPDEWTITPIKNQGVEGRQEIVVLDKKN